jgi:hypothetical protein
MSNLNNREEIANLYYHLHFRGKNRIYSWNAGHFLDFFTLLKSDQILSKVSEKKLASIYLVMIWHACQNVKPELAVSLELELHILQTLNRGFLPSYLARFPQSKLLQKVRNFTQKCINKNTKVPYFYLEFNLLLKQTCLNTWLTPFELDLPPFSWRWAFHSLLKIMLKIVDIIDDTLDWIFAICGMVIISVFLVFAYTFLQRIGVFSFLTFELPFLKMSANQFTPILGLFVLGPLIIMIVCGIINKPIHSIFCAFENILMEKKVIPFVSYEIRKIKNSEPVYELLTQIWGEFSTTFGSVNNYLNKEIQKNLK